MDTTTIDTPQTTQPATTTPERVALALLWFTPLIVAGWGLAVLPTNTHPGAPTWSSMTSHLTATLSIAGVAVGGLVWAVIVTWLELGTTHGVARVLDLPRLPSAVVLLAAVLIYAAIALMVLGINFTGLFPPAVGPLPPA